ncbi:MAG: hypothetical protein R3B13_30000 [Polyangiaceae bacterium]
MVVAEGYVFANGKGTEIWKAQTKSNATAELISPAGPVIWDFRVANGTAYYIDLNGELRSIPAIGGSSSLIAKVSSSAASAQLLLDGSDAIVSVPFATILARVKLDGSQTTTLATAQAQLLTDGGKAIYWAEYIRGNIVGLAK